MHRRPRVNHAWTGELAYVIGVFASDGNLSSDGRHLSVTSKDKDMIETIRHVLGLNNKIGRKARGGEIDKNYFVLQFGDITFYEFLVSIGLAPAKSKILGSLLIPDTYFRDFLRGCIDGDGSIQYFMHPESRHKQIRVRLCSASPKFLLWILETTRRLLGVEGGYLYIPPRKNIISLSFGIRDSMKILKELYYAEGIPALRRKREIAMKLLGE